MVLGAGMFICMVATYVGLHNCQCSNASGIKTISSEVVQQTCATWQIQFKFSDNAPLAKSIRVWKPSRKTAAGRAPNFKIN
ncbi:hypothetical protein EDC01DRAFT_668509 [Geopyxis carbonaria]|nr:hypothetical protein EDC01DRAFT_668509 [Geopyxis carbonaria]